MSPQNGRDLAFIPRVVPCFNVSTVMCSNVPPANRHFSPHNFLEKRLISNGSRVWFRLHPILVDGGEFPNTASRGWLITASPLRSPSVGTSDALSPAATSLPLPGQFDVVNRPCEQRPVPDSGRAIQWNGPITEISFELFFRKPTFH